VTSTPAIGTLRATHLRVLLADEEEQASRVTPPSLPQIAQSDSVALVERLVLNAAAAGGLSFEGADFGRRPGSLLARHHEVSRSHKVPVAGVGAGSRARRWLLANCSGSVE
jgi:hypothetical protein